jgi:HPt (histidine-containing phosphotransfer) domain-containing protein
LDAAQKLNHALKGVAGNLALGPLYDLTQQIDRLLKQQETPTHQQIARLRQLFSETQAEIESYIASQANQEPLSTPPTSSSTEGLDVKVELTQLKQRIAASEFIDDHELTELGRLLPQEHQVFWQELVRLLEDIEFEKAEAKLEKWLQTL